VNIGAPWHSLDEAERRVLGMQSKLHRWAASDAGRAFDDLHNLVYDPAFLVVAWNSVRANRGARSAGIDGIVPSQIADVEADIAACTGAPGSRRHGPRRRDLVESRMR
jgi:RNA-directed DNA polymerase